MNPRVAIPLAHVIGLCAILIPIALFPYPPLADYPAILARMFVLFSADDPAFAANYEVYWGYVPYLATDLVFPVLFRMVDPLIAGRLFLAFVMVLTAISPAVLYRVLHGHHGFWPLLGYLLVFHHLLFWGFLNYLLAAPLLVLALALWVATEHWRPTPRAALFTVISFALMTCHLFAWGALGLMILGYELPKRRLGDLVWSGVPFGLTLLLWRALPTPRPGGSVFLESSEMFSYGTFSERVRDVAAPLNFDFLASDVLALSVGASFLYWLARERPGRLDPRMKGPLAALAIGTVLMPHIVMAGWGTMRLPLLFAMVLAGAVNADDLPRRVAATVGTMATVLFALRTTQITAEWGRCQPAIEEVRHAMQTLEPGAALVSVLDYGTEPACLRRPAFSHLATYAVLDRAAFVPQLLSHSTVFSAPIHDELAALSGPLDPSQLEDPATVDTLRARADYLLYLHRGMDPNLPNEGFAVSREGSYFTLYRTVPPASDGSVRGRGVDGMR